MKRSILLVSGILVGWISGGAATAAVTKAVTPSVEPTIMKTPSGVPTVRPKAPIKRKTVRTTVRWTATPTVTVTSTVDPLATPGMSEGSIPPPPEDDPSIAPTAGSATGSGTSQERRWHVQAATGYAWTKARQLEDAILMHLNRNREIFDGNMIALGSTGTAPVAVTNSGGGSCTTVEAGYRIASGMGTGLRFGSVRGPSISGSCTGRGSNGEELDVLWDFDYQMTWLAPCLWMEGGKKLKYRGLASAGLGWGSLSGGWTLSYDFKTPLLTPFNGSLYDVAEGKGLMMEFGGDVSYPLNEEGLSAFLSGSYRVAKGALLEAIETGDAELDSYLAHLEIDFGGVMVQGGLRLEL